ncbi:hypothetical protein ACQ86N_10270 [Puia sp. P3]|uniref:hypothetical protein n=1 Tax=Puia sp. P3 TaxID=3423952 RepID=UPI003D66C6BC
MIQERFNQTIDLVRNTGQGFSFLKSLPAVCRSGVVVFSFFSRPSRGNSQRNVLAGYELRAELAGRGGGPAVGFAALLEGLRKTVCSHICVSVFITEAGTFSIFSDFDREELIGALYEPGAPAEAPVFGHLFRNGELSPGKRPR